MTKNRPESTRDPSSHGGRDFDLRYGVDTAGHLKKKGLRVIEPNREHGLGYAPIHNIEFDFGHYLAPFSIDYREYSFVDLGSGKGRAVLIAAMLPFGRVIGVEFAGELVSIAEEDVRRFPPDVRRCCSIVLRMDAVEFEFPSTPLVLYLWNPFGRLVMERGVVSLASSYERNRRRILVMYFTPDQADLFDEAPFLVRRRETRGLCIWDTAP